MDRSDPDSLQPAPKFFAPCIADYITFGLDHVTSTLEEIPDMSVTSKLIKVINTSVYPN